jgi:hypothetical protein
MTLNVHRQPRVSGPTRRARLKQLEPDRWKALKRESTIALVRRIVQDSDELALRVFLETRTLFRLKDEPPLVLPQFLLKLRDKLAPRECHDKKEGELADCTYDLTLSKYCNLPAASTNVSRGDDPRVIGRNVDCRNYYRAFLRAIERKRSEGEFSTQIDEESYAGRQFQHLVYKSFFWSKLECQRHSPFFIRYTWKTNGVKLNLYYPSYMTAREFRAWLEENVKDVTAGLPEEQERVQCLINAKLKRGCEISLDTSRFSRTLGVEEGPSLIEFHEGRAVVESLAQSVVRDCVKDIDKLRPGIRKLGKERIEQLITQIFTGLEAGDYVASRIARQYGISKATFNRFAGGIRFKRSEVGSNIEYVPDLWRNTAKILASNPGFVETVVTCGVAGDLKKVLDFIEYQGDQEDGK